MSKQITAVIFFTAFFSCAQGLVKASCAASDYAGYDDTPFMMTELVRKDVPRPIIVFSLTKKAPTKTGKDRFVLTKFIVKPNDGTIDDDSSEADTLIKLDLEKFLDVAKHHSPDKFIFARHANNLRRHNVIQITYTPDSAIEPHNITYFYFGNLFFKNYRAFVPHKIK